MLGDATEFVGALFDDALAEKKGVLVIWTPQTKLATFHDNSPEAASEAIEQSKQGRDVYFGLGLLPQAQARGKRGTAKQVCCITSFWCDIDVAHDVHKKAAFLPPTEEAAMTLLGRCEYEPSLIVRSGHGLQAYWLFSEPWDFENERERAKGASAARRWVALLQAMAGQQKWKLDSVGDLSRVFRVPGTVNLKEKADPKPVVFVRRDGPKYHIEDLIEAAEAALPKKPPPAGSSQAVVRSERIVLSPRAEPPALKLVALLENDRKFADLWRRKRQLPSPSEYDMGLANRAVSCEWTDQEIINLLITNRRIHGDDLKLRLDYYARTIAKARTGQQATKDNNEAMQRISEFAEGVPAPPSSPAAGVQPAPESVAPSSAPVEQRKEPSPPDSRSGNDAVEPTNGVHTPPAAGDDDPRRIALFANIKKLTGLEISRWVQRGREPRRAEYSLVLPDDREVLIGKSVSVLRPQAFREAVLDSTGVVMPVFTQNNWTNICRALMSVVEVVENEDLYRDRQATEWVRLYTRENVLHQDDSWQQALVQCDPFIRDGKLHVYVGRLLKFLKTSQYEAIQKTELYGFLSVIGFERVTVAARDAEGVGHSRSYWAGPASILNNGQLPESNLPFNTRGAGADEK